MFRLGKSGKGEPEKEEERYQQAFSEIIIFLGTREDYEKWTHGPVKIVDIAPESRVKGIVLESRLHPNDPNVDITIDENVRNALVDNGVEAIVVPSVSYSRWGGGHNYCCYHYTGLPVRKLSGSPHRKEGR